MTMTNLAGNKEYSQETSQFSFLIHFRFILPKMLSCTTFRNEEITHLQNYFYSLTNWLITIILSFECNKDFSSDNLHLILTTH